MSSDLQIQYDLQLINKQKELANLLNPFYSGPITTYASSPQHYRMRAEFRIWHEGTDTFHIMFNQQTKEKYKVDNLPAANLLINMAMKEVIEKVISSQELRTKLFQIDYLSSTTNELVISMIYHKKLTPEWISAAEDLQTHLAHLGKINIIGRAKKQKLVLGSDYVNECLSINGQTYVFKQIENSFTQPNASINVNMIEWVAENASQNQTDLLELYCGAGNFTIPLGRSFRKVFATEISKTSVNAAHENIKSNNANNIEIARLSSEEFVEAYNKVREFKRLKAIQLDTYDFTSVLVDPPRAGLDPGTLKLISQFEHIIYISCNPQTLAENLEQLSNSHQIKAAAIFDQFPFTPHIESGVILSKNNK
ncbi:tRNA (uridine(54)-C5)-methyltransferase TrmA [Glaciecola petra]|uniref:tRNA/tmRNA (uracil-C(5))-methyltransferase n=1 Tax=Glaciecola petra TaxID=3075602 RepID=A0ABU2ZW35_9ALTE|nr:tRNA (uridine(54)-C5)-methyltransferase TrmA [Aestuariibacter sp. P117]MDT0596514.1 tRNA (uridine(54)-C5)-methyltransferase TrmA [Aestuariibacter sp. P117]